MVLIIMPWGAAQAVAPASSRTRFASGQGRLPDRLAGAFGVYILFSLSLPPSLSLSKVCLGVKAAPPGAFSVAATRRRKSLVRVCHPDLRGFMRTTTHDDPVSAHVLKVVKLIHTHRVQGKRILDRSCGVVCLARHDGYDN